MEELEMFMRVVGYLLYGSTSKPPENSEDAEMDRHKRSLLYNRVQRWLMGGLCLVSLIVMAHSLKKSHPVEASSSAAAKTGHLDYAPAANLEEEEIAVLSKARRKIDIAMYAFTDLEIARMLAAKERQGVRIRVYRDTDQYAQEQSKAYGHETASSILEAAGVEVKVKAAGDLMHLKSYAVDDSFVRSGSANWSKADSGDQDNDVVYVQAPYIVKAFSEEYEAMWSRPDNLVLSAERKSRYPLPHFFALNSYISS
jgi:phosphatidylserine/phosphatidylglycerophosphate/cardiolipin synthase-like enzyme